MMQKAVDGAQEKQNDEFFDVQVLQFSYLKVPATQDALQTVEVH